MGWTWLCWSPCLCCRLHRLTRSSLYCRGLLVVTSLSCLNTHNSWLCSRVISPFNVRYTTDLTPSRLKPVVRPRKLQLNFSYSSYTTHVSVPTLRQTGLDSWTMSCYAARRPVQGCTIMLLFWWLALSCTPAPRCGGGKEGTRRGIF